MASLKGRSGEIPESTVTCSHGHLFGTTTKGGIGTPKKGTLFSLKLAR